MFMNQYDTNTLTFQFGFNSEFLSFPSFWCRKLKYLTPIGNGWQRSMCFRRRIRLVVTERFYRVLQLKLLIIQQIISKDERN